MNVSFEVPFRVATKLVVTRALDESPAGSAFAMVPGDEQTWYVTPGDSEGPLAASTNAIGRTNLHAAGDAPTCVDERYPSDDRAYASARLRCTFGSATPTSLEVSFSYGAIVRNEQARVVPLLPVREASLLVCRITKREPDDGTGSSSVPTAVDDVVLPCEPTTRIVYGPGSCDGVRERILVPRLVLEDGTIALGGAQYLWPGESPGATIRGTMRMPSGKGTIVARFGAGIITVPYDIDPSCGW